MSVLHYIGVVKTKSQSSSKNKSYFVYYFAFLLIFFGSVILVLRYFTSKNLNTFSEKISLDLSNIPQIILDNDAELAQPRNPNCSFWDCFNIYKCGEKHGNRISIYVYPLNDYVDENGKKAFSLTKEFYLILKTITESSYYTSNPNEACIFISSIDILNLNSVNKNLVSKSLASLSHWENGENHLLFNMINGDVNLNTGNALIAGAELDTWSYRTGFDISVPFLNPKFFDIKFSWTIDKTYLLTAVELNDLRHINILQDIAFSHATVLYLKSCIPNTKFSAKSDEIEKKNVLCSYPSSEQHEYPQIIERSLFCLISGNSNYYLSLLESLSANCIPVIIDNNKVLPFNEVIDWSLASFTIKQNHLGTIMEVLENISIEKRTEYQNQGKWLYEKYFNSLKQVIETTLDEINDRVFPHLSKNYIQWNIPKSSKATNNPLFLPLVAPKSQGFTAVVLTYDRVESLMTLIQKLSIVPSLQKILIIWNNQKKAPPHSAMFQKLNKPCKIIQTKENKLSNRFYPYEEIETEAILTIDDDIVMLTADELDFGYEVWREFPDRIVGFPSRTHIWNNITNKWTYESEWTNQISMVLTGAAFHHKYWSYMYTNSMPGHIKEWVDDNMNCEDIAMNFLVANITNKPPIKVAPRKKFKCPECTNTEMLSADLSHMMERSNCIDRFSNIYGNMPLKTVEFRADPVLYKDNFPDKLKRFNDIGSL